MPATDPRVDAYIDHAADFAKPILKHIRATVHAACPGVEETMKWRFPHFMYKGMLCGMAAFKRHCTLGFWKGSLVVGRASRDGGMGQFGAVRSLADLPAPRELARLVRKAAALNDAGVKPPARRRTGPAPEPKVPHELAAALARNRKARDVFEGFSPSHRREYVEWIVEAKSEDTRKKRLATTLDWLAQGKPRNWKYLQT